MLIVIVAIAFDADAESVTKSKITKVATCSGVRQGKFYERLWLLIPCHLECAGISERWSLETWKMILFRLSNPIDQKVISFSNDRSPKRWILVQIQVQILQGILSTLLYFIFLLNFLPNQFFSDPICSIFLKSPFSRPAHKMGCRWWLFLLSPRCEIHWCWTQRNIIDRYTTTMPKKLMKFLCFRSWNTHAHPASSSRQQKRRDDEWP